MKTTIKILIAIGAITLLAIPTITNANMFNRFKKGFYFEKYKNADQAKEALLKLHPIGSDVDKLIKTLERVGSECIELDHEKFKSNPEYKYLDDVYHCNYNQELSLIKWELSIFVIDNKINKIGIHKEYVGL